MEKRKLILNLFEIGIIQFGSFTLKSGIQSPFYIDFRRLVSYPNLLKQVGLELGKLIDKSQFDFICGVPYAALSLSTTISLEQNIPMLIKRKEAKKYGTKKQIEGVFEANQTCLIIDDTITSGISMLEVADALKTEGLKCYQMLSVFDRMQGGLENLRAKGFEVKALFSIKQLADVLLEEGKIDQQLHNKILDFISANQVPIEKVEAKSLSYAEIQSQAIHPNAVKLLDIMESKQTNLCCSGDVSSCEDLLRLADEVGPHISLLKTHVDNLEQYEDSFIETLKSISKKHNFLLFEDRKFCDIGSIVMGQFTSDSYNISEWADFITVHVVAGSSSLSALKSTNKLNSCGLIVVAEMSTVDTLTDLNYTNKAIQISQDHKDIVVGIVAQNHRPKHKGQLLFTPGINIDIKGDNLGQSYNTPQVAFNQKGTDVMIVGRGIYRAEKPGIKAEEYKRIGWKAYNGRL